MRLLLLFSFMPLFFMLIDIIIDEMMMPLRWHFIFIYLLFSLFSHYDIFATTPRPFSDITHTHTTHFLFRHYYATLLPHITTQAITTITYHYHYHCHTHTHTHWVIGHCHCTVTQPLEEGRDERKICDDEGGLMMDLSRGGQGLFREIWGRDGIELDDIFVGVLMEWAEDADVTRVVAHGCALECVVAPPAPPRLHEKVSAVRHVKRSAWLTR